MIHESIPQMLTPENLAEWIKENSIDTQVNVGNNVLTDEDRADLEHESSSCSQELDVLKEVKDSFNGFITNGTYDEASDQIGKNITIPATVGEKKLKTQRQAADKILRDGFRKEETLLYIIPWPEKKRMIYVDIQGQEWADKSRDMREDEMNKVGVLFSDGNAKSSTEVEDEGGVNVGGSGLVIVEDSSDEPSDAPSDDIDEQGEDIITERLEEPAPTQKKKRGGGRQESFI